MKIAAVVSGRADDAPMGPVIRELESRGVAVKKLDMSHVLVEDTPFGVVCGLSGGMTFAASELEDFEPDIVLLLGDRYEILGAAQVAHIFGIPIAHIHGGETTEGSFDNEFRNAITQLATWHFVSSDIHAANLAGMRGTMHNVFVVGAPGLDNIVDLPPQEFEQPYFLVTYHPATKSDRSGHQAIMIALEAFPSHGVIWTGVNNDPGRDEIKRAFYVADNITVVEHMTPKQYLSAMKYAACCVGNSSSFLVEAPALGVPTVNVGDRQKGRLRGPSVCDVAEEAREICGGINWALNHHAGYDNPYGTPGASKRIAEILTA